MSAQGGVVFFDGRAIEPDLVRRITEGLNPYGPDGSSQYVTTSVAMIFGAFHTTRESRWDVQPLTTQGGFVVTWDGRLDNREELARSLGQSASVYRTDLAVVGAAIDRWNANCFQRFVGDWAVTIWNPRNQEIVFAADYMTVRHIFYYLTEKAVLWSTQLSPLVLFSSQKFHIEDEFVAGYFANEPEADLTPFREIREVPGGHFVRIRNGKAQTKRFWEFRRGSRIRYRTDAEYEEHFRHVFRQSVRRRLRCDSPVLAELSGGLDSRRLSAWQIASWPPRKCKHLEWIPSHTTTAANGTPTIGSILRKSKQCVAESVIISMSRSTTLEPSDNTSDFIALPASFPSAALFRPSELGLYVRELIGLCCPALVGMSF